MLLFVAIYAIIITSQSPKGCHQKNWLNFCSLPGTIYFLKKSICFPVMAFHQLDWFPQNESLIFLLIGVLSTKIF